MNFVHYYFKVFFSPPTVTHATNKKERTNSLNNDQKICYDKIVNYLLKCSQEQSMHCSDSLKNHKVSHGRRFEINFTQSEKSKKWDHLINLLEAIEKNTTQSWTKKLLNDFIIFQTYHSKIIDQQIVHNQNLAKLNTLKELQDQIFTSLDEELKIKKELFDAKQLITEYKAKLEEIYRTTKETITDLKNNSFPDQQVKEFLQFWESFSNEFKFWDKGLPGVVDSSDLLVHIHEKTHLNFENLNESKIASFLIEEKLINNEIIFELQETNVSISPSYSLSNQDGRIVWISPGRQTVLPPISLRRSSSMVIIDAGYPNMTQNYVAENPPLPPPNCSQVKKIVDLALSTVNEEFSKKNSSEIENLFKEISISSNKL